MRLERDDYKNKRNVMRLRRDGKENMKKLKSESVAI